MAFSSPTLHKRFKFTEREEEDSTTEPQQEFGGLRCPIEEVITVSYVREKAELQEIEALVEYAVIKNAKNLIDVEILKGIKNPRVRLYFTPQRLRVYCAYTYERRAECYDEPDKILESHFSQKNSDTQGPFFTQDFEQFKQWVIEELQPLTIPQKLVANFTFETGEEFEVIKFHQKEPTFWRDFHLPYQYYLFIDIENTLIIEDSPYWKLYCLFEVKEDSKVLIGFTTISKSYHNLHKFRARISQFIILPDYQKKGLGYQLFDIIYSRFMANPECFEITLESPTFVMSKIYNQCVLKTLLKQGQLSKLMNSDHEFIQVDDTNLLTVFQRSNEEMQAMGTAVKCELVCCCRIYEFLIYNLIAEDDKNTKEKLKEYVKKRLFIEFHQDFMPNQRFKRLRESENRIKAPYCVCYEQDGEEAVINPSQDIKEINIDYGIVYSKLEIFYGVFLDQAKDLAGIKQKLLS
ncbi:unnamed protein product [Moneuplotes crassus]|uniref:N-acetyltransferase domain-containing protein n=1 Tax=Euplotes crassus TaxID=5936 RepID=A0AAD1XDU8_EUPCR|nr:unnamed protein product [Moneuplotes crassus]